MKAIVVILGLVFVLYLTVQVSTVFRAKEDLRARVERNLDFVDEQSIDSVKLDLIAEARKLGVALEPRNIDIVYADTEQAAFAQKYVGGKLGAQFQNKQIGIKVEYDALVLGVPWRQTLVASKIKQIAAPVLPPRPETQELLDSNQ